MEGDEPGRYRLTTNGIFFAANSLRAISSGSDSPANGTSTGAFILHHTRTNHSKDGIQDVSFAIGEQEQAAERGKRERGKEGQGTNLI
jgi:hypothetical protein